MADAAVDVSLNLAIVGSLILAHELGHYLAGAIAGVPRQSMRVVVTSFPPHVALLDDGEWISPREYDRFSTVFSRYVSRERAAYGFVAGGHVGELAFVCVVTGLAMASGFEWLAARVVWFAILLGAAYLVVDLVGTGIRGVPHGDFSGMWAMARGPTVAVYVAFFGTLFGLGYVAGLVELLGTLS